MKPEELYTLVFQTDTIISTDTRTIMEGDVYVGLKGEVFDGNMFAKQALDKGARLAIIDDVQYKIDERCIVVENTYETLKGLATLHRQHFSIPILVIGGSNGKTTTKELITAVLAKRFNVYSTKGNFNNEIGVPLTVLGMKKGFEIAVIEIGANHPGEHTVLMNIVQPTHVLVTNNGMDHLEGFGSIAGVRKANKEIYDCARRQSTPAFVNKLLEDLVVDSEDMSRILYPTQSFQSTSGLYASLMYNDQPIRSQLFGSFNEANILAAIAIGEHFNVPMDDIAEAIQMYEPTLKRSQVIEKDGYTMVIDCYNANPTSMELSLNDFFTTTSSGSRIVIVGDMFEVGTTEEQAHKDILMLIEQQKDIDDIIVCVGPRFSLHKDLFPFHFFPTSGAAKDFFDTLHLTDKKIFLKASRAIRLEEILTHSTRK